MRLPACSGLQNTTASINAILVQASVVIVPLLEAAPPNMGSRAAATLARLLPSALALGGVVLLTVAPSEGQRQEDPTMGILMSLSSAGPARPCVPPIPQLPPRRAVLRKRQRTASLTCAHRAACYALHTIRLSEYGDVDATVQAAGQARPWPHRPTC